MACNGMPLARTVSPKDPAHPESAKAKNDPKTTVTPRQANPTRTKRAGPVGRSHAVSPRSATTRPKPATRTPSEVGRRAKETLRAATGGPRSAGQGPARPFLREQRLGHQDRHELK